ncbi:DUF2232 domain-containing protein [Paenactinomyces guangxiensis]|uniref:DUF2232 domain-containing protein n=1 Tax=Paenactinomyces guangxiensis TaxID=1490290 RepID=A0A7W2A7Y5_9BACL|nr:DUF2232 domain-containing protein [Paenactinomyces guangxiensis]MBA4494090.1 DUF2232 domain-containing protein [Paenactinomyces guangxiensis]MBH8591165.1 DUF2232 domain-containing protein [Paenactinomyces guangxiensis]
MSEHIREVVKDSLLCVGLFFLLLASLSIPLINLGTLWFLPLPFLILTAKQRLTAMVPVILLLGVLISIFSGYTHAPVTLFAVFIGLVMGYLYHRKNTSGTDVVLGGFVAGLVVSWAILLAGQYFFQLMDRLRKIWETEWNLFKTAGLFPEGFSVPPVETFIPVLLLVVLFPMALLNFLVARRWLMRNQFPGKYFPPFRDWRLPRPLFYFYFVSLFISWFLEGDEKSSLLFLLIGILWVLQILFLVQGFAFAAFLLHHWKKSNAWLILVFLVAMSPLSVIVHLLGIVDTGSRLRERIIDREKE